MSLSNMSQTDLTATGRVVPYSQTRGATADGLATGPRNVDAALWEEVNDTLLSWLGGSSSLEEEDQPSREILESALDFTDDLRSEGQPAPSFVVPSRDGLIAFEWHYGGGRIEIVEVIKRGTFLYTQFTNNKVTKRVELTRNPLTRKMQLSS